MWAGGFLFALYALRVDFRLVRLVLALVLALVLFIAIVSTGCTILVSGRLLLLHIHRDEMSVTDDKCSSPLRQTYLRECVSPAFSSSFLGYLDRVYQRLPEDNKFSIVLHG